MTRVQLRERRLKLADAAKREGDVVAVAKIFGVSCQLVRKSCREFGVRLEDVEKKRKSVSKAEVLADLRGGKTPEEVAHYHGVSPGNIARIQNAAVRGGPSRGRR